MKLDPNFTLDKYGLNVRFVNEDDAEYILKLRTNPQLGKYLNQTQNNLQIQKEWITEYKKREKLGTDYYFIYLFEGKPIGLNRIYNIKEESATTGSWICSPNIPFELPLLTVVIIREIFFEILNLKIDFMDTRKNNTKVIKMHHLLGAKKYDQNEIDVFHTLTKEDFLSNKPRFLKYINSNF